MAKVINKGGTDKTVILNAREWLIYPFQAPNWTDLRVGFFLSLTTTLDDDTIPTVPETVLVDGTSDPQDRYWIGVKDRSAFMPNSAGAVAFAGFVNEQPAPFHGRGDSVLQTSDIGIGTTNAYYWRPRNGLFPSALGGIVDGGFWKAHSLDGVQNHFVKDVAGAGGYATAIGLRLQRTTQSPKVITVTVRKNVHSSDLGFSNTPTKTVLQSLLEAWPATVQQWGPAQLNTVPSALYCYWPFHNSRLRIHSCGFVKVK
jgi:hypothetical protein